MPTSKALSSRTLPGFPVATTRIRLEPEDALGTGSEGAPLQLDQAANAGFGEGEERVQTAAIERRVLRGPLHFDELPGARHDDVHVDVRGGVLAVVQVEQRRAVDDADADGGDAVADDGRRLAIWNASERIRQARAETWT